MSASGDFIAAAQDPTTVLAMPQALALGWLEQLPGPAIVLLGGEPRVAFVNAAHRALFDSADWPGQPLAALPAGAALQRLALAVHADGRTRQLEQASEDDAHAWLSFVFAPLRDAAGAVIGVIGQGLDVGGCLRASHEREDQQRRLYESILTNTPDLAYVFDLQHRFIYANEGLLKMWGKTLDEALGKTCLELGYEPWHAAMHDREIEQVKATRQPIRGEVPFNATFGRRVYEYIFVPVLDEHGEVVAVSGTTRDVTERQQTEQQLRALADELAESDRLKTEFLAMLAHELRNPLAPLRNALQIIARAGADADAIGAATAIMQRQITQMVRLVDDLLDVSRISRGRIALQREPTGLADVIRQSVEICQPAFAAARQQLHLRLPAEPLPLHGDVVRLTQVFSNLLHNAAKYSPPGAHIELSARREGRDAVVSVRDPGTGIAPENLTRIFDMFVQVDDAPREQRSGLGIGLALARTLVELHDGDIEAHSDGPGRGSTFVVRLPLADDAQATAGDAAAPAAAISGRRILVVDDNQDSADTMSIVLELTGNITRIAYDGHSALQIAASFAPDLVLLDIGLPDIDGYETCRRLLAQRRVPVVAISGWGRSDDRQRSAAAGFAAHLVKPVDHATLNRVVNGLLAGDDGNAGRS